MLLKFLLKKIDWIFCHYLGLNVDKVSPNSLRIKNNQLIVTSTIPFKRHMFQEQWNDFDANNFKNLNKKVREKVGLAAGKTIAKGLIISFEDISIDKSKSK